MPKKDVSEKDINSHLISNEKDERVIFNAFVYLRCRPMSKDEISAGSQNIVKCEKSNHQITVQKPNSNSTEPPKIYFFDNIFDEKSTQVSQYKKFHFIF